MCLFYCPLKGGEEMNDEGMAYFRKKLDEIVERTIRIETMFERTSDDTKDIRRTLHDHDERLHELENHKAATIGIKDIVLWAAMAGLALWEVLK